MDGQVIGRHVARNQKGHVLIDTATVLDASGAARLDFPVGAAIGGMLLGAIKSVDLVEAEQPRGGTVNDEGSDIANTAIGHGRKHSVVLPRLEGRERRGFDTNEEKSEEGNKGVLKEGLVRCIEPCQLEGP